MTSRPPAQTPLRETDPPASQRPRGAELTAIGERLAGEMVAGRYRIEEPIGRGASGFVLRGYDLQAGAPIALKFLDVELARDHRLVERFKNEAGASARVGTPHVVTVYDAGLSDDLGRWLARGSAPPPAVPFLVMELLRGGDFRDYLTRNGPMPAATLIGHLRGLAETLDRAHELGIVHRDIKPANLYLNERQPGVFEIKLLDFGVAQLGFGDRLPSSKGLFGTPWYMSPEQIEGRPIEAPADRWALAMVTFRMLSGESYWPHQKLADLLGQIVLGARTPPSEVVRTRGIMTPEPLEEAFDRWFFRACAIAPGDRFATCSEQVSALAEALLPGPVRP